jgi:hypothetical protein
VKISVGSITSRLSDEGYYIDREGSIGLERSLGRSEVGVSTDIRTPFAGEAERESIIERYTKEIGFTKFRELTEIDEKEISKIGPYSIMLPWKDRRKSVSDFETQEYHGNDSTLDSIVDEVGKLFAPSSLRPMGLSTAVASMPRRTMLGLPTMSSDEARIDEYSQRASQVSSAHDIYPCVAGWRGQPQGLHELPKQRLVWMFDHVETILGLSVLYPILNKLRVLPGFSAWSNDLIVDDSVTRLLIQARTNGVDVISADFSNFDASVSFTLLRCVFDLLRYWFTDDTKYRLDLLEEVFATVPLITPDGIFNSRKGGVPSGSALTNLVDTLVNVIAGKYAAKILGIDLIGFEVLGDDSVFVFKPTPNVAELSGALKELGLDCNPEKQFISPVSAHFLQRWHSLDYQLGGVSRGVRSIYRALNGMLSLEHWVNVEEHRFRYLMAAREIMQVNNTRWHPMFKEFVSLVKDDDKILRTGIDPTTVFKRAGGSEEIRSILHIASFPFNQQDPDLVEEFAATLVLRELAKS